MSSPWLSALRVGGRAAGADGAVSGRTGDTRLTVRPAAQVVRVGFARSEWGFVSAPVVIEATVRAHFMSCIQRKPHRNITLFALYINPII